MAVWGDDALTQHLDKVHSNQRTHYARFPLAYRHIAQVDNCFERAGKNLTNVSPVMAGNFLLRCFYAYRTAAGMALAGQVVETFAMLRSTLEWAGYCLAICETPALEAVWIDRHASAADMTAQKKTFLVSNIRGCIARHDVKLASIFDDLYQRAIDFGGHPNPQATFSAMTLEDRGDGETALTTLATSGDPTAVGHALKSTAQVGLTALYILQHGFKAKFELLGIRQDIETMRKSGAF